MEPELKQQVKQARGKFAAMASAYGLGTFNDSFFRQSAILLAAAGAEGWIMAVFTLPYLLFAPWAGWLADRFPKRTIVIGAKVLELLAMSFGAYGMWTGSWPFIYAMVFTMGLQSCIFSPALNGSIPELYPAAYVTRANATLRVIVTMMILGGVAASGPVVANSGRAWIGIIVLAVATLGVICSLGVVKRPAADPKLRFPWHAHKATLHSLLEVWRDRLFRYIAICDVFVWFAGSLLVLLIKAIAVDQWGYTKDIAGYLTAAEVIGVAVGGVVSGYLARSKTWYKLLPPYLLAMGIVGVAIAAIPYFPESCRLTLAFVLLALIGMFGGAAMIPCEGFIQVRPAAERKGEVIAAVNFVIFAGILVSGPLQYSLIDKEQIGLQPSECFAVLGVMCLLLAAGLWKAFRRTNHE